MQIGELLLKHLSVIKYENSKYVPGWVIGRNVELDGYHTDPKIAKKCFSLLKKILRKEKVKLKDYTFLEPSAGSGSFYDLLPAEKRIGIDIEKYNDDYITHEFLTWNPSSDKRKYIAVGNPPFGYRGWLALSFLNRASDYCDYVGFILPKGFISESRGSPKYRVPTMKLIHSEELPNDIFRGSNGKIFKVNTVWQVWKKIQSKENKRPTSAKPFRKKLLELNAGAKKTNGGWLTYKCDEHLDLYTVDKRKERLCGIKLLDKYDFFLQRSFFNKQPKLVHSFDQVKYVSGYGFIIKKNKRKIMKILNQTDWRKYCTLTVHNVHHISMYHIRKALVDGGLKPSTAQKKIDQWT